MDHFLHIIISPLCHSSYSSNCIFQVNLNKICELYGSSLSLDAVKAYVKDFLYISICIIVEYST